MKFTAAISRVDDAIGMEICDMAEPQRSEVLVKMEACGICHTDLLAMSGSLGAPFPAVFGHEGVGRIVSLGKGVDEFAVGDRVLMSFGACGECGSCENNSLAYCRHALSLNFKGQRIDGTSPITAQGERISGHFFAQSSFATHAIARTTNMVKLAEDLPPEHMAPLACGVQTGMSSVVKVLAPAAGSRIAIFGCGSVGLAAIMAAKLMGCSEIIAIDLNADRVSRAKDVGATIGVVGSGAEVKKTILALGGIHNAFDSTGNTEVIELGFSLLLPQGNILCAGISKPGNKLNICPRDLVFTGRSIIGTVEGDANPRQFIPDMIEWYRQGLLPIKDIVKTYPFESIEQAIADLKEGRVVKPVLLFGD